MDLIDLKSWHGDTKSRRVFRIGGVCGPSGDPDGGPWWTSTALCESRSAMSGKAVVGFMERWIRCVGNGLADPRSDFSTHSGMSAFRLNQYQTTERNSDKGRYYGGDVPFCVVPRRLDLSCILDLPGGRSHAHGADENLVQAAAVGEAALLGNHLKAEGWIFLQHFFGTAHPTF